VIPKSALLLVFMVLLAGSVAMVIVLGRHGAPLKRCGGYKILCLELAPTASRGAAVVESWDFNDLTVLAYEDIRFDYAFIALYTATLAMAGFYGRIVWNGWLSRAGRFLGWAMFVAGPMDVLENIGMTFELDGHYAIAPFVCTVSSIKWIITLVAFPYAVATVVRMLFRVPLLLRQDRVHSHADSG
jgi:hypothetical protein